MATEDDYESVLFVAREVYVYRVRVRRAHLAPHAPRSSTSKLIPPSLQIPPRTSSEGYKAAAWYVSLPCLVTVGPFVADLLSS